MDSPFAKSFDDLLNNILTDYQNHIDPETAAPIDVSQGSLPFIKGACMASALWGIYQAHGWIADQIFPDTASSENLHRHAFLRGLAPKAGESDLDLLARLLDFIRRPPAGGNRYDYVKWVIGIQGIKAAFSIPLSQGPGTVDVIIVADTTLAGSEVPSSHTDKAGTVTAVLAGALVDAAAAFQDARPVSKGDVVRNVSTGASAAVTEVVSGTQLTLSSDIIGAVGQSYAIDSLCTQALNVITATRPVTAKYSRVLPVAILSTDITIIGTGANFDKIQTAADISFYLAGFEPNQTLYPAALWGLAIQNGAENIVSTYPAAPVIPASNQAIRPGVISVP